MRFNKKYQRGIFILFLLLIIISGIPIVNNISNNNLIDDNSLSMSAPEDPYEENDDPLSAYYIGGNEGFWLSYYMGPAAQWDDDYYEIYVSPGEERLIVFLRFKHFEGDIDIELINGTDFSLVIGSYSVSDDEFIDIIIPAGVYYLRVYYENTGNSYDLLWEDFNPAMTEDYYEENDYDYESYWLPQASWLSDNMGLGFQNDNDWYEIRLEPGEEHLFAELVYNRDIGWLQMEIYDGFNWWSFGDVIDFNFGFSGTLWLRVFGDNSGIVYDLWWEDIYPGAVGDDWMEENDDFYSAWWIERKTDYYPLKIVDYDEDWFRIDLHSGDTIDIKIFFDTFQGDLDLELYDPGYGFRLGSYTGDPEERIMYTVDVSGEWRIRVYRLSGSEDMWYDLDIQLPLEQPRDDEFEENDGFWSAAHVMPSWYGDLRVVEDDEDWYQVYINAGDIIDVSIHFWHQEGDLQLELYDPTYTDREGSYSSTEQEHDWSKEHIMFRADMSGDWRIRVYHETGDSDVHYDLDIKIVDDFYEYNNDWMDAYQLKDDEYTWLSDVKGLAVQGDDDWYRIVVSPGFEHLIVNLKFNQTLGSIHLNIYQTIEYGPGDYSLDWTPVLSNYSMTGDYNIDINNSISWGVYFIQIYGDNSKLEYDLWWDDLRTDFRPDDNYEEDDDPQTAYDISFYENTDLWHISGWALQYDDDWYQIQVYSGREQVFVDVYYDYQEGVIGVELYDWDYNRLGLFYTESDWEYINYEVPSNGTYYIRIFGDRTGNVYSIKWHTESPETEGMIPGYDIFIMLGAILGIATVVTIKIKRSKKNF